MLMTNQQILEKAIQKAIDSGFATESCGINLYDETGNIVEEVLIFNHDFAKALWGETVIGDGNDALEVEDYFELINSQTEWGSYYNGDPHFKGPIWKFYLQQMAIAEDPIKYLGEHV